MSVLKYFFQKKNIFLKTEKNYIFWTLIRTTNLDIDFKVPGKECKIIIMVNYIFPNLIGKQTKLIYPSF